MEGLGDKWFHSIPCYVREHTLPLTLTLIPYCKFLSFSLGLQTAITVIIQSPTCELVLVLHPRLQHEIGTGIGRQDPWLTWFTVQQIKMEMKTKTLACKQKYNRFRAFSWSPQEERRMPCWMKGPKTCSCHFCCDSHLASSLFILASLTVQYENTPIFLVEDGSLEKPM